MFRVSGDAPESVFSGQAQRTRRLHSVRAVPARPAPPVDIAEAEEFLRLFYAENRDSGSLQQRLDRMRYEVETVGSYRHTPQELTFGAQVAWRNNARCIGRLYWRSLKVRDLRDVHNVSAVAAHCVQHLRMATNNGKIRPVISVFPPEIAQRPAPRIWNEQLIRYAGYRRQDGSVLGDPRYVRFTEALIGFGWRPPAQRSAFDVLPLVVETAAEGPHMFALPAELVKEVPLSHPELPWFAELGLRWHAVPVISNMRLRIGGVSYPAAPFNGWYMGTEIGARNFGDTDRYDLVPVVAEKLGLDTSREDTLWRDRALVELNRAVLHSYQQAGVTITDHHTESKRFLTHLAKEEAAGRKCPVDWSWIVPPMSGSQTPVFHRYYDEDPQRPDFLLDDDATRRALEGGPPRFAPGPR
ncbi:nitric oxide synthase oxygenase [Saccharopolyspora shandongensis]|uniref:nitric oxide synthase oxygenase n=1 Tax=Saccharopolyspora shandongensis TaxID=418495 RepID=UPI003F4CF603